MWCTCRFIENQDWRIRKEWPRNRHTLLLPPGKLEATLADASVKAMRHGMDEPGDGSTSKRRFNLCLAGTCSPIRDVVADGIAELHRSLGHNSNLLSERCLRNLHNIQAITQN